LPACFGVRKALLYHYAPSRSQLKQNTLLTEKTDAIMVDGYDEYQPACPSDIHHVTRLGCWAHARLKFVEAQTMQPKKKTGKADIAISWIQKLYKIEASIKDSPPELRYLDDDPYPIDNNPADRSIRPFTVGRKN